MAEEADESVVSLQVHEHHATAAMWQVLAVRLPEGGTGYHCVLAGIPKPIYQLAKLIEPGPTVIVG